MSRRVGTEDRVSGSSKLLTDSAASVTHSVNSLLNFLHIRTKVFRMFLLMLSFIRNSTNKGAFL